jgi:putative holliday junction resolvase
MLYCASIKDFSQNLLLSGPILGVDYGLKKTGLSFSDKNRVFSMPYKVIKLTKVSELCRYIQSEVNIKSAVGLVVGYPLDINGNVGESCNRVNVFLKELESHLDKKMPYFLQDERFSTKSATRFLDAAVKSKKRRAEVEDDSLAASYILQTTLDSLAHIA